MRCSMTRAGLDGLSSDLINLSYLFARFVHDTELFFLIGGQVTLRTFHTQDGAAPSQARKDLPAKWVNDYLDIWILRLFLINEGKRM